jgi:hypothetical protein
VTAGLCPGASTIKCCTQSVCATPSGDGVCMSTSQCKSVGGSALSGYCTGPSDLPCRLGTGPTPTPPTPTGNDYYYNNWCGGSLQYLEDKYCAKVFPSSYDRDWVCPVYTHPAADADALLARGYYADDGGHSMSDVVVDTETLGKVITNGANLCVIMTKRVQTDSGKGDNGVLTYNKYFCAGDASATEIYETWSSSKIFAIANAGGHLRSDETTCAQETFGLDSSTTGKHGTTLLGDLVTIVCSYDHTAGYTSNSLSSYFHDMVS